MVAAAARRRRAVQRRRPRARRASGRRCGSVAHPVAGGRAGLARRDAVRELAGAPVPPHILELMTKGRTADGSKAVEVLELGAMRPTQEVCTELFEWAKVTPSARPARSPRRSERDERREGGDVAGVRGGPGPDADDRPGDGGPSALRGPVPGGPVRLGSAAAGPDRPVRDRRRSASTSIIRSGSRRPARRCSCRTAASASSSPRRSPSRCARRPVAGCG